ncbi:MAG: hypothetical protein VXY04_06720 [Pseudomonadota bacterium]|nr:hypothetical protein [Pseudomonadota bacterium]
MNKDEYMTVRRREIRNTTATIRFAARVWMLFCILVAIGIGCGVAYLLMNPEVIGAFFGDIVAGFEGAA